MDFKLTQVADLEQKILGLNTAQKVLLFVVTIAVLGAGFYYLRYKPQAEKLRRVKTEVANQEKRLGELKQAAAKVQALEAEITVAEEEFNKMLSLLPNQQEIPGLLDSISRLAAQVGLENVFFQPQPEQLQDFYAIIPIRLDFVGKYHELGVFLDKLSRMHRIVKVDNLNLGRQKDAATLQVSCTLTTYRFLDKSEQQKKEAPKKK
jgi:type IV pilus assembly protein PilO